MQIRVLDMGKPIHIMDLLRELIRLSGKKTGEVPLALVTGAGHQLHGAGE